MRYGSGRNFVFRRVYDMAALVEECVNNPDSFIEIDWTSDAVLHCLVRFQKTSLLHHYIFSMIAVEHRHEYRKNEDLYEDSEDMRSEVEEMLRAYDITFISYDEYVQSVPNKLEDDFVFHNWFTQHEVQFEQLWDKITDEVFHLLFANRAFLLTFNESLAQFLSSGQVSIPASFLNKKGVLKRRAHFPVWLTKAVVHRDQGKCVLCHRDLTGLINTDFQIHFDHIVPLKRWGTNDPCNIQTLCADCNLRKSGQAAKTTLRYLPWWDY